MRLFIATFLDEESQDGYQRLIGEIVRRHRGVLRSVPERTVHLTYVFGPRVPEDAVGILRDAIAGVCRGWREVAIRLKPPRVLMGGSRPRLVHAAVDQGDGQLRELTGQLAAAVCGVCPDAGFEASKAPHATLARFRKDAQRRDARAVEDWLIARGERDARTASVCAVQLVRSETGSAGAAYTTLDEFPLLGSSRGVS